MSDDKTTVALANAEGITRILELLQGQEETLQLGFDIVFVGLMLIQSYDVPEDEIMEAIPKQVALAKLATDKIIGEA